MRVPDRVPPKVHYLRPLVPQPHSLVTPMLPTDRNVFVLTLACLGLYHAPSAPQDECVYRPQVKLQLQLQTPILTFYVPFQVVWPHDPYWSRPHLSGIVIM